ncbi:MAG: hypothetical protein JRJ68_02400 [Deltaproteobacteria bacterium]|nr:hypothetical protein [Deltaproteobacteria bacterium]
MSIFIKAVCLLIFVSSFIPQQAFAIRDTITGAVSGAGKFFMDDTGLDNLLNNNEGWEVGVGPSIVLVDEGMAKTMNNTTITESVYVFTFSQQGLMAGAGIQGSKISKISPKK